MKVLYPLPIVGPLLVQSATVGGIAPIIGMLGFSLALALPFSLFAVFPGWMNSLPQSGGWLNTVKVVLGFVELALALKFLSKAEQFGNQIENGKMMFIYQAQLAFKIWHNLLPKINDKLLD